MKTKSFLATGLVLALSGFSALALDKTELDARITKITGKFEAMQQKLDKRVPPENLQKAQAILLLDRTKAGFIFAFQGGSGVAMMKDPKSKSWSPVAFYKANEASLGFQVGGQQSFMVILFMNTNATRLLTEPKVTFAGEASGTAGESSAKEEGSISPKEPSMLVYDDRQGLYGGAAIKGGEISPDDKANQIYYGESVSVQDILQGHKVKPTPAAIALAKKINELSKAPSK